MKKPNILIYFIDEIRADVLGCYGHPVVKTPVIDKIAAEGMKFDSAYSNCPLCMPARNSFFTGQYPSEHGITFNGPFKKVFPELAEKFEQEPPDYAFGRILRNNGFKTIVNVGKYHTGLPPEMGSFTEHHDTPDRCGASPDQLPDGADPDVCMPIAIPGAPNTIIGGMYDGEPEDTHPAQTISKAIEVLEGMNPDESWVLRVSIDSPHTPVLPPAPFDTMYEDYECEWEFDTSEFDSRTGLLKRWSDVRQFQDINQDNQRRARQSYYGMTSFVDSQIGRLENYLESHGLNENLITIVIADHGSSIGDHGLQVKGPFDTDDIAHIPLIIRYPEQITPDSSSAFAQIIDIVPTLAELLNSEIPDDVSGKSLLPILKGEASEIHQVIFSEGTFPFREIDTGLRETIRTHNWLYTRYNSLDEEELFDLTNDPKQTCNVANRHRDIVAELSQQLDSWRSNQAKFGNFAAD